MAIDNRKTMSKTQHYRKVTKPLLERKRRARMNLYLDELKDLIVETMEAKGEHVAKLEKADILELTVTFLKNKQQQRNQTPQNQKSPAFGTPTTSMNAEKFRAGYTQAAYEVSKVFASVPELDVDFGTRLMKHLGYQYKEVNMPTATSVPSTSEICNSSLALCTRNEPEKLSKIVDGKISPVQNQPEAESKDVWRPW